jgi:hypothetical protein
MKLSLPPRVLPSLFVLLGLLSMASLGVGCSHAREEATQEMDRLQRAALADLKKGKAQEARKSLLEAVRIGKANQVDDAVLARTHLALGAVYAGPLKDSDKAVAHMSAAIEKDPEIKLKGSLATPAAKRALNAARAGVKAEGAGRGDKGEKADKVAKEDGKPEAKPAKAKPEPAPEPTAAPPVAVVPVPVPKPRASAAPEPPAEPAAPVAAAPKPRPVAEEAAAPARGSEPLSCRAPDEAPPDNEVMFRCAAGADTRVTKMILHYRAAGSELFTDLPMTRNKRGWYIAVVPASATTGKSLQYFVEGRGPVKVSSGSSESPNLILVREGAAPAGPGDPLPGQGEASAEDAQPSKSIDENPLEAVAQQRELERDREASHRRGAGHLFLGFGLGTGYGWQPGGTLEFHTEKEVAAGPLSGGLINLLPELGYQLSDDLALSLQARLQFVPADGSGDPKPGSPVEKAYAVLVRAVYAVGATSNLRGFLSACVGGGDGFRLKVPRDPTETLVRSDTVRGGPFLAGAGLGLAYHFNSHAAWTGELRAISGLPSLAVVADLSTGLEVGF